MYRVTCSGAVFAVRIAVEKEITKHTTQAKRNPAQNLSIWGRAEITRALATAQSVIVNAKSKPPGRSVVALGGRIVAAIEAMMAARSETIPIMCLSDSIKLRQQSEVQ
jgi:hypothetical protein